MTHQYKKRPVTMKMWMQFNVMPWTSLGADAVYTESLALWYNSYGQFKIKVLRRNLKQAALLADWTSAGSLFHTVGAAILKA